MISRFFDKIKEKTASGSLYIGVTVMIVAYIAVLVCVNLYQLYSLNIKAQLICDTIADGAAVAGQITSGFDENLAKQKALDLYEANKTDGMEHSYSIAIERQESGQYAGCMKIEVSYRISSNAFGINFLNSFSNENANSHYIATAKATAIAKTHTFSGSWLRESFLYNNEQPFPVGIEPTNPGNRNKFWTSIFIGNYLSPKDNPIYSQGNDLCVRRLVYDYLMFHSVSDDVWKNNESLSDIYTAYNSNLSDSNSQWSRVNSDPEEILSHVNEGKPTLILCKYGEKYQCYIVSPEKNLEVGQIAVAYTNESSRANFEKIDWQDFCDTHSDIIIITTD